MGSKAPAHRKSVRGVGDILELEKGAAEWLALRQAIRREAEEDKMRLTTTVSC